ncbi:MAG: ribonuclease D [Gammaproteobacteria bacterium]|nr:ribonuclease D [Gammaproteobacteria bacterium]
MPAPVRYIESERDLQKAIDACMEKTVVSVDTEFARFNTYYPMVGLIQIYEGEVCYLIDPLVVDDLSALADLLVAEEIIKVFHACSEDMEVFKYCLDAIPSPVVDTQIAAAALGVGFSISYQNMVEHYLSVNVPKEETRSDWLQRPLTMSQLKYAALDVIYLLRVYEIQRDHLQEMQRENWVREECDELSVDLPTMIEPDSCYHKLKGLWKLDRKQLSVLKALCAWREVRARELNVPRNRIVEQKSLMNIASANISQKQDLQYDANMSPRQVRKYGDDLLFLAGEARLLPEKQCPQLVEKDAARVDSKQLGQLRQVVRDKAEALSVAPELLTKRRHLEQLLRSEDKNGNFSLPVELSGWRKKVIGNDLIEALG